MTKTNKMTVVENRSTPSVSSSNTPASSTITGIASAIPATAASSTSTMVFQTPMASLVKEFFWLFFFCVPSLVFLGGGEKGVKV